MAGFEVSRALATAVRVVWITAIALAVGLVALALGGWLLARRVSVTVRELLAETTKLRDAVREGALATRGASAGAHVAIIRRAMGVFSSLGRGDFEADLELLPGKK